MQNVKVDRDKYIGGSDIPAIMGISTFKTRWELLQEKAGLVEDKFEGNEYTEYGNIMEPKIRDFINESQKDKFIEGKDIEDDIRCHTDGINKTTVLEIKTTSQIHDSVDEYKAYLVQLLFYMEHTKRKKGILAVYERPKDFNEEFNVNCLATYEIDIKDYKELVEKINEAVDKFREDLQKIKENPFLTEQDLQPKDIIEYANKIELLEDKLKAVKQIENDRKEVTSKLYESMYSRAIKKWTTPRNTQFTVVEPTEDTEVEETVLDAEKLKAEMPEVYEKYLKTETKVKKGRAGYLKITFAKE